MADHGGAFQFQRLPRRRLEACALDARAAFVQRQISDVAQIGPSARLADLVGIGLLVERMGRDARRGRGTIRGHALELEPMVVENAENGVAPARNAAQRRAFDDLGHVHGDAGRKPEHGRDAREYAGIAGAPEHDDVHVQLQGAPERLRSELPHDVGGRVHIRVRQRRHGVHRAHAPRRDRLLDLLARQVRGDDAEAECKAVLACDLAHDLERLIEVRSGAGRACGADDQGDVECSRRTQHLAQVALGADAGRRHLAGAQIGGADVDGAHVDADHVRCARKSRLQSRRGDAIAELPGGAERAQRPAPAREVRKQSTNRRHSSISRSGACCWAP